MKTNYVVDSYSTSLYYRAQHSWSWCIEVTHSTSYRDIMQRRQSWIELTISSRTGIAFKEETPGARCAAVNICSIRRVDPRGILSFVLQSLKPPEIDQLIRYFLSVNRFH
jgi:hypothetical protein